MRLVRILIVLFVVLSSSAWAAPTQAELPSAWSHAALQLGALLEHDLQARLGCDLAQRPNADPACDVSAPQINRPVACLCRRVCVH